MGWWPFASQAEHTVTLFTRIGCHLCEDAHSQLESLRQKVPFRFEIIDIDSDPALVEIHDQCVPVVAIDGKIRFRGRVNALLLRRLVSRW